MSQVLDPDKSLSHTVARVIAWLSESGAVVPSSDTGAYSKARKRLPLSVIQRLLAQTAQTLSVQISDEQRWLLADGNDGDAVRYPANQQVYPQHGNQKQVWLSVGKVSRLVLCDHRAVLEVSIAAFKVSEWEMSRQLYARLQPEDVVVADSAYGTYVDLVLVQAAKADAVFRKHRASAIFVKVRNWRPYRHLAASPTMSSVDGSR